MNTDKIKELNADNGLKSAEDFADRKSVKAKGKAVLAKIAKANEEAKTVADLKAVNASLINLMAGK